MDAGDIRPIKAGRPVTEADLEAASVPWSPGPKEYAAHLMAELEEAMGWSQAVAAEVVVSALGSERPAVKEMGLSLEEVARVFDLTPDEVMGIAPPPLD